MSILNQCINIDDIEALLLHRHAICDASGDPLQFVVIFSHYNMYHCIVSQRDKSHIYLGIIDKLTSFAVIFGSLSAVDCKPRFPHYFVYLHVFNYAAIYWHQKCVDANVITVHL